MPVDLIGWHIESLRALCGLIRVACSMSSRVTAKVGGLSVRKVVKARDSVAVEVGGPFISRRLRR